MLGLCVVLKRARASSIGGLHGLAQLSHGPGAHIGPVCPWGCSFQCLWTLATGAQGQRPPISGCAGVAVTCSAATLAGPFGVLVRLPPPQRAAWRGYAHDHK